MKRKKSKLESLTSEQIEEITNKTEIRKNIPLVKTNQVNMRIDNNLLSKIKRLAVSQGLPYTTFIAKLLKEDIERLWSVYKKSTG
jgi:predicted DNA binding CopG/RHH family protein